LSLQDKRTVIIRVSTRRNTDALSQKVVSPTLFSSSFFQL
jgi:hypothetical protein